MIEATKTGVTAEPARRLRSGPDPHPRRTGGGARPARHVHRVDRGVGPAPPRLRGRRQLGRRGPGRLLHRGQRHHPHRQLGDRGRQRPRHPGGPPRVRPRRRRGRAHQAPRRRQVRQEGVQGLGRPARRRRLGGERALRDPRGRDLARRQGLPPVLPPRHPAGPAREHRRHRPPRHQGHLQAGRPDLRDHDLQLRHPVPAPARALLPEPGHPHHPRGRAGRQEAPLPVRGRHRLLRRAPEPEQGSAAPPAHLHRGPARRGRRSRSRCSGTTATRRTSTPSPTTSTPTTAAPTSSASRARSPAP